MVFSNNLLMGAAGQATGYEIDQSIRFNDNDTAYLDNTTYSGSPTSGTDCTFSFWVKRCNLSTTQCLFFGGDPNGSTWEIIRFESDDQFRVAQASSAYDITTTQVFRDVGAWSHFVVAFDTDNGTAADRIKIYHNGSRITNFSLETNPSSGYVTNFNTGGAGEFIRIGYQGGGSNPSDVYLAEINFVDGQALDPTSFGETNAGTGQWVPKKYTGSYGTNGFYITGADSADLGADDSGNGNDFTSSGLTAADQVSDSPTDNFCTWNPLKTNASATLSDGNLNYTASGAQRTTSTFAVNSGKWYAEFTISAATGSQTWGVVDIAQVSLSDAYIGQRSYEWGIDGLARTWNNGSNAADYTDFTAGDVIGIALDMDNGKVWFRDNDGTFLSGGDPAAGTTPDFSGLSGDICFAAQFTGGNVTINCGQSAYTNTPPTGFNALSTANLPDPTIADPSAYFQTTLYTGNGTAIGRGGKAVDQSGNSTFQPDFVWIKNRSAADNHMLYDAVRGATKDLHSNTADAEATDTEGLSTFDADGFTVGSNVEVNTNTENYVGWQWKANGSGSSNTDGTVTSTVSADATSGFSIAKWTHTTASNYTVGHGLGAVPKMIIVKTTDQGTNWGVYHSDITVGNRLLLNSTSAQIAGYWGANSWTSSTFSIGSARDANGSTMIGYCFAEVEGFSKFGSYTGNGSTDGPFIYTGFMPEFIIVKSSSNAGTNWDMLDATREPFNDRGNQFEANTSDAEANNDHNCDFLSNGFKWRDASGSNNGSGYTIIYMAFARSPFKTSNAQ